MYLLYQFVACFLLAAGFSAEASPCSNGSPPATNSTPSNVPLRILPLGNSITWGYLSSDGNGYRLDLLNMLTANGTQVQYIGSQQSGNMTDNYNEGHPGAVIDEIAQYAQASLPDQPNLILLMAGTNDMNNDNNTTTAPDRLGSLIDECHNATMTEAGSAVIIVAQLTPAANNATEERIQIFNAAIPGVVAEKVSVGMKVLSVDMEAYVTFNDLKDGLHPNDYGYNQMAKAWYAGVGEANGKGWFTAPVQLLGP
ncbi:SGNH hydrolase [Mollisia scopiformis]|uniref:SGNH hydrolase n=1 Tax=Mollisia scopiformis TaxID=149040 RepID=A0A194XMC5_MOLSC|nr:SGNH hydrolase [Mollisia scopiformis]KUJ21276.1 SGNH hydrolase [Mollisia scopiformis]